MTDVFPPLVWLVLALLAYLLVTGVLSTMAARIKHELDRHNLLVEHKRRQLNLEKPDQDSDVDPV